MRLMFCFGVALLLTAMTEPAVRAGQGDEPAVTLGSRDRARAASLIVTLRTIRMQVQLYRDQHKDGLPDLVAGWEQLLSKTNLDGRVGKGEGYRYGPYLRAAPVNPFNDASAVCPLSRLDPKAGWAIDTRSGVVYAVVSKADAQRLGLDDQDAATY